MCEATARSGLLASEGQACAHCWPPRRAADLQPERGLLEWRQAPPAGGGVGPWAGQAAGLHGVGGAHRGFEGLGGR